MMIVGWRELLCLPELGIDAIRAKVDSGARSSALHATHLERISKNGVRWIRFKVDANAPITSAEVIDERNVTDSGGHVTLRPFIRTTLRLGGVEWPIELNLTERRNMLFPMLLGRTAMAGRLIVDPARSFLLGE
jgi:hypothetical protein